MKKVDCHFTVGLQVAKLMSFKFCVSWYNISTTKMILSKPSKKTKKGLVRRVSKSSKS
ncbi:hypothetical protein SERLADRAFT_394334, partial [Serpula lacrymans var. lacrymans S7.9]